MRRFSSYGPVSKESNFYVPRTELVEAARRSLIGENPTEGGHYITVWASRQTGKTWVLRELYWELQKEHEWLVANIDVQHLLHSTDILLCMNAILKAIDLIIGTSHAPISSPDDFQAAFSNNYMKKPLILIIDEFDSLGEDVIAALVAVFRNIYTMRLKDSRPSAAKEYLLHGLALIGVRSVVGIENRTGSPFNVQRSLHVPNLTEAEVNEMFRWYEKESGQEVEQAVIDGVWNVTRGQPGLVSWFGELLTEQYNPEPAQPLTLRNWELVYSEALTRLPNNTIMNIISKARTEPYRQTVLALFQTSEKVEFRFERPDISFLYMNGVIDSDRVDGETVTRFSCQFVQEKLFDYFSDEIYGMAGRLLPDPFIDLEPIIDGTRLDVPKLLGLYQDYFVANREYILSCAPRRADNQIFEATYHFNFYAWLERFLRQFKAFVLPEFPTGNGKIDLLLRYAGQRYGIELKSFTNMALLSTAIGQAGRYGRSLGLEAITLAVFTEQPLSEDRRSKYAQPFPVEGGCEVQVIFLTVG